MFCQVEYCNRIDDINWKIRLNIDDSRIIQVALYFNQSFYYPLRKPKLSVKDRRKIKEQMVEMFKEDMKVLE